MGRPDPIEYAERLYGAIRAATFSPPSFLAFGNAVKDGVGMRNMPRIAAEPFMRVVGEMLDLEEQGAADIVEAVLVDQTDDSAGTSLSQPISDSVDEVTAAQASEIPEAPGLGTGSDKRRKRSAP